MSNWLTAILVGGIVAMFVSPFILLVAWLPMRRKAAGEEVSQRERMAVLRNAGVALVAVVVVVAAGFLLLRKDTSSAQTPAEMPGGMMGGVGSAGVQMAQLPKEMAGLPLAGSVTGSQALQQVASMHSSDIPVTDAVVGSYRDGGHRIDVWAAYTPAAQMAPVMAQQMATAIRGGQTPFTAPIESGGVWRMEGMGQVHYFFASGNAVWWVSADKGLAEKALAQTKAVAGS